jgi:hypothetical protein
MQNIRMHIFTLVCCLYFSMRMPIYIHAILYHTIRYFTVLYIYTYICIHTYVHRDKLARRSTVKVRENFELFRIHSLDVLHVLGRPFRRKHARSTQGTKGMLASKPRMLEGAA